MSSFLQICKDVRAQAGLSGDGPSNVVGQTGIYSDVVRWVEEAYNEIQSLHENWNFLFKEGSFILQAGFSTYPIAETEELRLLVKGSLTIQYNLGFKKRLRYIPYTTWRNSAKYLEEQEGQPTEYTELPSGDIKFYPSSPTLDYQINYEGYSRPHVMVDSVDTPLFASQWHEMIKLKALIRYSEFYNSPEIYESATRTFSTQIKDMEFSQLPRDSYRTVPFA